MAFNFDYNDVDECSDAHEVNEQCTSTCSTNMLWCLLFIVIIRATHSGVHVQLLVLYVKRKACCKCKHFIEHDVCTCSNILDTMQKYFVVQFAVLNLTLSYENPTKIKSINF